jgi:hypothetical protein
MHIVHIGHIQCGGCYITLERDGTERCACCCPMHMDSMRGHPPAVLGTSMRMVSGAVLGTSFVPWGVLVVVKRVGA